MQAVKKLRRKRESVLHHRDHSIIQIPIDTCALRWGRRVSLFVYAPASAFPPNAQRRNRFACRRQRRHRWCHRSRRLAAQSRYISRAVTRDRVETEWRRAPSRGTVRATLHSPRISFCSVLANPAATDHPSRARGTGAASPVVVASTPREPAPY